jgi:hypothetical protein
VTEHEWLACRNPHHLLGCARRLLPSRCLLRWRLFNAGCVRRIENGLSERCRQALRVFERYADEEATAQEWRTCRAALETDSVAWERAAAQSGREHWQRSGRKDTILTLYRAVHAARAIAALDAVSGATATESRLVARWSLVWSGRRRAHGPSLVATDSQERKAQCDILRDVMGNPFRPVTIDARWLAWSHGAAASLVQSIRTEGVFSELPVLADALEEAGCTDPHILEHLRGPGPHVRGCWALDSLRGKME